MMAEIEELLAKLKELDLETWEKCYLWMETNEMMGKASKWVPIITWLPVESCIQGVIQDAIVGQYRESENKQWVYSIKGSTTRSGPRYFATVSIFTLEPDNEITETRHESHGSTPAEAILSAYVACLEAQG